MRRATLVAVFCLFAVSLATCRRTSVPAVRVGYLPIASDITVFIALERQLFNESGLKVDPIRFETSNQIVEALVAGRIDATSLTALEVLLTVEAVTPAQFKIFEVSAADKNTTVHRFVARTGSGIKTLRDLKGRRIGTLQGSQMKVFTSLVLARFMRTDEFTIVQMAPALQVQALAAGQVDAIFSLEPTGTVAEASGVGYTMYTNPLYDFLLKPFPTAASVVSSRFLSQDPAAVSRFVDTITAAHRLLRERPDEARQSLLKFTPIQPEHVRKVGIYDYWSLDKVDRVALQRLADLYVREGILTKPINTATLLLVR